MTQSDFQGQLALLVQDAEAKLKQLIINAGASISQSHGFTKPIVVAIEDGIFAYLDHTVASVVIPGVDKVSLVQLLAIANKVSNYLSMGENDLKIGSELADALGQKAVGAELTKVEAEADAARVELDAEIAKYESHPVEPITDVHSL